MSRRGTLFEKGKESGDDCIPDELANLIKQAGNRPIPKSLRFLESYESGSSCFHLHIAIKGDVEGLGEPEGGDWCLVVSSPNARLRVKNCAVGQVKTTTMPNEAGVNNMQQLMFVSVREVSQNGKRMRKRILPSCESTQGICLTCIIST